MPLQAKNNDKETPIELKGEVIPEPTSVEKEPALGDVPAVTEEIIEAKNFANRADLEKFIGARYNLDTIQKDVAIVGDAVALKNLHLAHGSLYWGIRCREEDYVQRKTKINEIDRGRKTPFGVNGDLQDSILTQPDLQAPEE
jgi:hypothetical protein